MNAYTSHRGVTLIELLVGMSIMVVAIAAAIAVFISQGQSLRTIEVARDGSVSARDAMIPLESSLNDLGWGIDPRFAIDMTSATRTRDSITGPDELSFVARNPFYQWLANGEGTCLTVGGCFAGNAAAISAVDLTGPPRTVTITLAAGRRLQKGRIMLALCAQGGNPVMITLSANYLGTGAAVVLTPNAVNAAPYNDYNSLRACHAIAGAALFAVDRYHFFVSATQPPWLMLDTGVDLNGNGVVAPTDTADLIPIAKNVEDFQVSYAFRASTSIAASDNNSDWIIGNNRATAAIEELNVAAAAPLYATGRDAAERFTTHPANVEEVRLSLTFRSDKTDQGRGAWLGDTVVGAENRTGSLTGGKYHRSVTTSEVRLFNLSSKSQFIY